MDLASTCNSTKKVIHHFNAVTTDISGDDGVFLDRVTRAVLSSVTLATYADYPLKARRVFPETNQVRKRRKEA